MNTGELRTAHCWAAESCFVYSASLHSLISQKYKAGISGGLNLPPSIVEPVAFSTSLCMLQNRHSEPA